jgi:putative ribosome biogenesis GTPase RsgA
MFEKQYKIKECVTSNVESLYSYIEKYNLTKLKENLHKKCSELNVNFEISIIGLYNRGKSTFINALLGQSDDSIAPVDSDCSTLAPVCYTHLNNSDKKYEHMMVLYDGYEKEEPISKIRDYVTEQGNPKNTKGVRRVTVYKDFSLLKSGCLVDSPGVNSLNDYHDDITKNQMIRSNAIVFLIAADKPICEQELEWILALAEQEKNKIFWVVTKIDKINTEEIDPTIARISKIITAKGLKCEKIYQTSGKNVLKARKDGSFTPQLYKECGFQELEYDLENYIIKETNCNKYMKEHIKSIKEKSLSSCDKICEIIKSELELANQDINKLNNDKNSLESEKIEIQKTFNKTKSNFYKKWDSAIEDFLDDLNITKSSLKKTFNTKIFNKSGIFKYTSLNQEAFRDLIPEIDDQMKTNEKKLSNKLETITNEFFEEFDEVIKIKYIKREIEINSNASFSGLVADSILPTGALASGGILTYFLGTLTTASESSAIGWVLKGLLWGKSSAPIITGTALAAGWSIILVLLVSAIIYKLASSYSINTSKSAIDEIIDEKFDEVVKQIKKFLENKFDEIIKNYEKNIQEAYNAFDAKLNDIIARKKRGEPENLKALNDDNTAVQSIKNKISDEFNKIIGEI